MSGWAAGDVDLALSVERGAWPDKTPVTVIGGEHEGLCGSVRCPAWAFDDDAQQVADGPPPGYAVTLDRYREERHMFRDGQAYGETVIATQELIVTTC